MAFTVRVQSSGSRKIETIKLVRELIGCGLREAKDRVEALPFTVPAGDRDAAGAIAGRFRALGLSVDILEGDRMVDAAEMPAGDGLFQVMVDEVGSRKIQVIKVVRDVTRLDLLSAKNLVDRGSFPLGVELDRDGAEHVLMLLNQAGATAHVVSGGPKAEEPPSNPPPKKPPPGKIGPMPY